jgi:hypothetical protein
MDSKINKKHGILVAAATSILFGLLRGAKEAIVMHQPNPREHNLFRFYHTITIIVFILFAAAIILTISSSSDLSFLSRSAIWIYLLFLSWTFFEIAYPLVRNIENYKENLFGLNILISGNKLITLHCVRIIISILYGGLLYVGIFQ